MSAHIGLLSGGLQDRHLVQDSVDETMKQDLIRATVRGHGLPKVPPRRQWLRSPLRGQHNKTVQIFRTWHHHLGHLDTDDESKIDLRLRRRFRIFRRSSSQQVLLRKEDFAGLV